MQAYEYRVVAAPRQGINVKGARTTEERFAAALQALMNELGAEGWDYVRADTLPCEERQGLTGRTTVYQNMLVFRRALAPVAAVQPAAAPLALPLAEPRRDPAAPAWTPTGQPLTASPAPVAAPAVFLPEPDRIPPLGPARELAEGRVAAE